MSALVRVAFVPFRDGVVLGLLRLAPACLRLLHDLSPLRTPDGEDAEFDD